MGILKSLGAATKSTFADQWKDIITADTFDEYIVVVPGINKTTNSKKGSNTKGSEGVISNGSKIFVPENTAAFIFSQAGIENIINIPGGYEYKNGDSSIFNGDSVGKSIIKEIGKRFTYGGVTDTQKEIAFVNLREIRNIKFGTRGPQVYHDKFYECDLEIYAYGSFSVKIIDPEIFIKKFVPANTKLYSFEDEKVREQIIADFLQSFIVALNSLSSKYRISEIPSQANELSKQILNDETNAGSWKERFGFEIVKVSIENIEFSQTSRDLVNQYNSNKMSVSAYEDVSQRASNIAAQQKIAQGVEKHGFGDVGGMILGANIAGAINHNGQINQTNMQHTMPLDEQIEALKKLKELLDMGILSQEEFNIKKKEIMGL